MEVQLNHPGGAMALESQIALIRKANVSGEGQGRKEEKILH